MQFTRIYNISDLKIGNKIAIANSDKDLDKLVGSNINLTTGIVVNSTDCSVLVTTDQRNLIITNITMKMQAVYLVTNAKSLDNATVYDGIELERKLRKSEKLNKRYKAILNKKFNVTDEELALNFKKKQAHNKYYKYKTEYREIPYIRPDRVDKVEKLHAKLVFKENSNKNIMCEITVLKGNEIVTVKGIAVCHKDDIFNRTIGEVIASTKAINNLTCELY